MVHDPSVVDDDAIRGLFEMARSALPGCVARHEGFAARVHVVLAAGIDVDAERARDLFLASACEEGNGPALAHFESMLMPSARVAMARVTSHDDLLEEATQELRKRLFCAPSPRIISYSGRGPLWKWLRVTAMRTVHDLRRSRGNANEAVTDDVVDVFARAEIDPEFSVFRQRYAALIREAMERAIETLSTEEKTLLRLRYAENQGIDSLSVFFQAHRATMARRLQNLREKLVDQVQSNLAVRLPRITRSEARSLWRVVRSQVHLSFSALLQPDRRSP